MPFLTYDATRPWAKAIKAAVLSRKTPPWFADPRYGHFANDPSLTPNEIDILARWADTGAIEGDPKDSPPPIRWPDNGWRIRPDVVISMPAYRVPAKGDLEWTYVTIPSGFTKDTWVTSVEILPGDPSVLNHAAIFFKPHKSDGKDDDPLRGAGSIEAVYVPGFGAMNYRVHDAAKLVPANADLVIQVHYTPKGQEVTELIRIGFTSGNGEKPRRRFITWSPQAPAILDSTVYSGYPNGYDPNWASPSVDGTSR